MSDEISSLSEESEGEGPNIRPPQAHVGSAGRKSHKYKYREADVEREGWRVERHREAGRPENKRRERKKSSGRGEREERHRRDAQRDRGGGGGRRGESNQNDLRYRLNSSRDKHRSSRDRDQERHHHDARSSREDRDKSNPSLSRMLEADKQHKRNRREVEDARRQRELLEKEMDIIAAKLKRKHKAKSRSPEQSKKRRKSDSEGEEGEDESGDDEEESSEGNVSGSEESRSDITGSEKDEDTPDREEESEEGELQDDELEEVNADDERRSRSKSQTPIEGRWAEKSSSPERTPSRSPTPLMEEELMEEDEVAAGEEAVVSPGGAPSSKPGSPATLMTAEAGPDPVLVVSQPSLPSLPPYLPSVHGCRAVIEFDCLNRIEEGTYGVVYRARDKRTQEIVALKKLKMEKEKEGFPITSLREINTLLISQHPNVVTVREIVVGSDINQIYIVMDFVEHDLKGLMETMRKKKQVFLPGEVKCLMVQLLSAIHHLHDNWILHRDLKSSNLLLSHNGILKVGDFGLAREYGSPLLAYTAIVVTLWYRAPELLLGLKNYSTHIDVWSIGCIFGELLLMEPLFPGKSETDELNKIFKLLGTPSERVWGGFNNLPGAKVKFVDYPVSSLRNKFPERMLSESGLSLLKELLTYDPKKRINCEDALKSSYFKEHPQAIDPSMFPTWPAKSEQNPNDKLKKTASPKAPSGGHAFKSMQGDDDDERAVRSRGFNLLDNIQNRVPSMGFTLRF